MSRDRIYSLPRQRVGQFQFDDEVARVFPDMIARSVPGYASILSVIEQLAARFVRPHTHVYDLGCSLGAATMLIRQQSTAATTIFAVDRSTAMIDRLNQQLAELPADDGLGRVETRLADLRDIEMSNASLVVLNFTLQFVPSEQRLPLLQHCFDALVDGGALLLSEKVCFDDSGQQELLNELHLDFKRACGYSELEIAQKRTSLEKLLVPESLDVHVDRLRDVGFDLVAPWFQCFNFASILAVRS